MTTAAVLLALKVAAVLGVAAAGAAAARRAPARVRVGVWTVAVAAGVAMPILATIAPPLGVTLPGWPTPTPARGAAAAVGPVGHGSSSAAVQAPPEDQPTVSRPSAVDVGVSPWLLAWLLGVTVVAGRELASLIALRRMVRTAGSFRQPDVARALARAASRLGCQRPVRLLASERVPVPVTAGLLRPVVILPEEAAGWSAHHLEVVLSHELVHVRRGDWAVRQLSRLLRAVHWFDPLAWWAVARLEVEQERACDDEVVASGVPRSRYAACLLTTARSVRRPGVLPAPALDSGRRPRLEVRVMSILQSDRRPEGSASTLAAAAIVFVVLVPVIAAVQPAEREAGPELAEALRQVHAIEARLEPHSDEIQEIQARIAPHLAEIEDLEVEIDHEAIAAIEAELEPYRERLEEVAREMAPVREQLERIAAEMQEVEIGRLDELGERLEPHTERLEALQLELEPYLERIHAEMEPLHQRIEQIHVGVEPLQRHAEQVQVAMEPMQAEIEEVQRRMEPMLEEIERAAVRVEKAVRAELETVLREDVGQVVAPGAPFGEAARRLADLGDITVRDDLLRLDADRDEVRDLLDDLLSPHRVGTADAFEAALDAAASDLSRFRLRIDPALD